jgi:uncharacterized membrane protein
MSQLLPHAETISLVALIVTLALTFLMTVIPANNSPLYRFASALFLLMVIAAIVIGALILIVLVLPRLFAP